MQDIFNVSLILIWPLICCILFLKLDTVSAVFISLIGGMLFLPVGVEFDLPLVPAIDKNISSSLGAILGIILIKNLRFYWLGGTRSLKVVVSIILGISFVNFIFNTSPLFTGAVWKPGLSVREAISAVLQTYLTILPFLIGLNVIKTQDEIYKILKYIVISILIYIPFIVFELRFSPQLHNMVYGFHPHEFIQQIRAGGFRSVVFLGHGLLTANYFLGGFISLLILLKVKCFFISKNFHIALVFIFFSFLIALKSATAVVLALLAILIFLFRDRMQKYALQFLVLCVAFYPLVVFTDIIPLDWLYDKLQLVLSLERINSLYFRFSNEQEAVEYLGPRIMIGFGGLGRAALDGLITDGTWLVWTLRFGSIFWMFHVLLHTFPLFKKNLAPSLNNELTLLSILPVIILIDQIPNSSWSLIWIWFFSGALWGYSSNLYKRRR